MKVSNISAILLSALFSVAVSAAPLGEVSSENGKIFSGENYMVVKKDMKKGEQIKPHDHPGFKTLIFAVGKGSFDVTLNQTEKAYCRRRLGFAVWRRCNDCGSCNRRCGCGNYFD